jgi:hypothetical protein
LAWFPSRTHSSPIERQASGEPEEEYVEPVAELRIPECTRLAQLFCSQPDELNDEELAELRIEAGKLTTALCLKRKTPKQRRIRQRP